MPSSSRTTGLMLLSLLSFLCLGSPGVDAAEIFSCGEGGKPDVKTAKCICPPSKIEQTVGKKSSCVAPIVVPPPASPMTCRVGMIGIPGGTYKMSELPGMVLRVEPYCLDKTEVTVQAYEKCWTQGKCTSPKAWVPAAPSQIDTFCNWKHPEGRGNHPINCIDWHQAVAYCAAQASRLPTEEEWEWAARSGDKGWKYPWGNNKPEAAYVNGCGSECPPNLKTKIRGSFATVYSGDDGFAESAPVGSFPKGANRWGVLDLSGNVCEWTASPEGVVRGGSWDLEAEALAAGFQMGVRVKTPYYYAGFRCASNP